MNNLIDVHVHIFPGIDDGAISIEETEKMLQAEYDQGVRTIVATPHYGGHENKGRNRADEIWQSMDKTRELVRELYTDMEIICGSEIYCTQGGTAKVIEFLNEGTAITINETRYVLVETGYSIAYSEMFNILRQFTDGGYHPILAHVERYDCLYKKNQRISELISHGVTIQMNAESLVPDNLRKKWGLASGGA